MWSTPGGNDGSDYFTEICVETCGLVVPNDLVAAWKLEREALLASDELAAACTSSERPWLVVGYVLPGTPSRTAFFR